MRCGPSFAAMSRSSPIPTSSGWSLPSLTTRPSRQPSAPPLRPSACTTHGSAVRVCLATAPFYSEVNSDLLVTGAILHDIGKTRELHWKNSFGYTLEGQLIGHISIAQGMLLEKTKELAPFPEKLRVLVEHMILSHHGKYEFGSPKLPMTAEALLLNMLDDLEAKMQVLRNEFAAAEASGKSAGEMTEWVRSMDRPLLDSRSYLKD
jgi:3'-5' exoribonuclease